MFVSSCLVRANEQLVGNVSAALSPPYSLFLMFVLH